MIIHRLSASGFKIIGQPITIDFPQQGRIGVFGQNESGKSTLLESIEYALYGLKRGGTAGETRENVVTWGKPKAILKLEFTSGENRYLIEREIGSERGHQAKLYVVLDGSKDLISKRVTDIGDEVERITGMDRDTFTKLVFIKQKDLDALRDLSKSNRERLVNKVMGMEVFDESVANIKEDIKNLEVKKKQQDIEFEKVKENKETYEQDVKAKQALAEENKRIKSQLTSKKKILDAKKSLLERYEWLNKKNSNKTILHEVAESLRKDEEALDDLKTLNERIGTQDKALENYKPKVETLEAVVKKYRHFEEETGRLEDEIGQREKEKEEETSKSKLSPQEIEDLKPGLPARKTRWLTVFVASLLVGISLLVAGLLLNFFVLALVAPLILVSAFSFKTYRRLDRISELHGKLQAIATDLETKRNNLQNLVDIFSEFKEEKGYAASKDVEQEIRKILLAVKTETGANSIGGLEDLLESNKQRARNLKEKGLEKKIDVAKQRIESIQSVLKALENNKPVEVEGLTFTEETHEEAKRDLEKVQQEHAGLKGEHDENKGKIKTLNNEIKRLRPDYERFPILEEEIEELEKHIEVRRRAGEEIRETSKELRSKVLPYAEFIINDILPTITDGRYSDLEISEDLKFKVHSMDAGQYKERDIFSGGTQDQFLIALRLAFTRSILDSRIKADHYSLLMDECISSSDETRKQGIFEVLDLMKKTFRQIFIIAHEDISNVVDHHLVLARNSRGHTEIRSRSW